MTGRCPLSRDLLFTALLSPGRVRVAACFLPDALESALSPQPASLTCTPHARPSRDLSVQPLGKLWYGIWEAWLSALLPSYTLG